MNILSQPLLYGTSNPGKLSYMRQLLAPLGFSIIGLSEISDQTIPFPEISESGSTPLENARIKALAYYKTFHRPVFSADSGLYFSDASFPDALQPGVFVRRRILPDGSVYEMSDSQMTAYYRELANQYGSPMPGSKASDLRILHACYHNALCFVYDETHIFEFMDSEFAEPFYLSNKALPQKQKGFPLDPLSIHPQTGQYYFDLEKDDSFPEEKFTYATGYRQFFSEILQSLQ